MRRRWVGRIGLALVVAASCQPAEPVAVEQGRLDADDARDAGARTPGPSLVFCRVFLGPGGGPSPRDGTTMLPEARTLVVGPGGDVWIAGRFFSSLRIGDTTLTTEGGAGVFVARLDPQGNPRWAGTVGGPDDVCGGLAVDMNGNAIVAHQHPSRRWPAEPIVLTKLGTGGERVWQKPVTWPRDEGDFKELVAAASDRAGGILVLGNSIEYPAVARIDADGNMVWNASHLPLADAEPVEMAVDGAGNAYIGSGSTTSAAVRLTKVTAAGAIEFRKRFRGYGYTINFFDIGVEPQGNVLLSGFGGVELGGARTPEEHREHAWTGKLDPSGNLIWQVFGRACPPISDGSGNVFCVSRSSVTKLDPSGQPLWEWSPRITERAWTPGSRVAAAFDSEGRLIYTGAFKGSADFGGGVVDSGEGAALFVAALAP